MDTWILIVSSLVGYLLGSLSFGRIVARFVNPKVDLDHVEMMIPGADEAYQLKSIGGNTASMKLGPRVGCTVGLLDILKVFLPTLVVRLIYPDQYYFLAVATAGFVGHCWPIYYRFKGGRGISAFYGGLFAIDPVGGFAVAIGSLLIGMLVLKELLFAYVGGVFLVIPWLWFSTHNPFYLAYALVINLLFILAMIPELKQIIELRRKYGKTDMKASMETFPMGQQMLRLMNKLNRKSE
jgi:glycerol-3-phosphate acyltransferase PlsY